MALDSNRGGVMAWDGDRQWYWFKDQNETVDGRRETRGRWEQRRRKQRAERSYRRAATKADIQLQTCKQQEHGYLKMRSFVHELGW